MATITIIKFFFCLSSLFAICLWAFPKKNQNNNKNHMNLMSRLILLQIPVQSFTFSSEALLQWENITELFHKD